MSAEQRAPEAADIGDENRLRVAIELRPGQLLDQLLQRADPARQGDEGVRPIEHRLLALMHAVDDEHFLRGVERVLLANEEGRDDPGHVAAGVERRPGQATHQPFAAAAVDEADPIGRKRPPELFCGVAEPRVVAVARSAIDADVSNRAHGPDLPPALKRRQAAQSLLL